MRNPSPEYLDAQLRSLRDKKGVGCNNELLRLFGDITDEETLNNYERIPDLDAVIEGAKRNMEKCVVLMYGIDTNYMIAPYWFSFLEFIGEFMPLTENTQGRDKTFDEVIKKLNQPDLILHEHAKKLHSAALIAAYEAKAKSLDAPHLR